MNLKQRLLALLPVAVLAACGGGSSEPQKPAPTGPLAAYAGFFQSGNASTSSSVLVHPQGQVVGEWVATGTVETFAGAFAVNGTTAQRTGADFATVVQPGPTTTQGTADVALSLPDSSGAITATITNASPPAPQPTITATRQPVLQAFIGLPFGKLGGDYVDLEPTPWVGGQHAHLDATTGAVTGDYAIDCHVAGTVSGYDNVVAMFLLDATFSGSGCAAVNVPVGSGRFVGYLSSSSRFSHLELVAVGFVSGQRTSVLFQHSEQTVSR